MLNGRMGRRGRYVLLAGVALVAVGLIYGAFRYEREPEYGGKSLSEWVEAYGTNHYPRSHTSVAVGGVTYVFNNGLPSKSVAADEAIRAIGTNAVPYLAKWARYQQPAWKRSMLATINRFLPLRHIRMDRAERRAENSIDALIALGPDGKAAFPALAEVLSRPMPSSVAIRAIDLLPRLGPYGLAPLIVALTNAPPTPMTPFIVARIVEAGTNAQAAIPALRTLQRDPPLRQLASNALYRIGSRAADGSVR